MTNKLLSMMNVKHPKNILLVEDDEGVCNVLCIILEQEGFKCYCTNDGMGASRMVRSIKFDLIILDIALPKVSGIEFCNNLRSLETKAKDTPVLFTTALSQNNESIKKARLTIPELAEDQILWKPFEMKELIFMARKKLYPEEYPNR